MTLESTIVIDSMADMHQLAKSFDYTYLEQIQSLTTTENWASDALDLDDEVTIDGIRSVFPNLRLISIDISDYDLQLGIILNLESGVVSKFFELLVSPLEPHVRATDFDIESEYLKGCIYKNEAETLLAVSLAWLARQESVLGLGSLLVNANANNLDVVLELGEFDLRNLSGATFRSIPRATFDTRDMCIHLREWPGWGDYEVRIPQLLPQWFIDGYATLS